MRFFFLITRDRITSVGAGPTPTCGVQLWRYPFKEVQEQF